MFSRLSLPVDHYDPRIQHDAMSLQKIQRVLTTFNNKTVEPKNFRALGEALTPSPKDVATANTVVSKVQACVHKCERVSIDRSCISGSFGKKTALPAFDIDLVLFVNHAAPPFEQELEFLNSYLSSRMDNIEIVKKSPFSISFYLDGFKVDLLLAPNMASGNSDNVRKDQYQGLLEDIASAPEEDKEERARFLSAAFAESTVHFMKSQSSFVNCSVRIAKLWKKSCSTFSMPRWFSSFLIELIARDAACYELLHHRDNASLVRAFRDFLTRISHPERLELIYTDFYSEKDIPPNIRQQKPLVMDPVNPFLNVAKTMDWTVIKALAMATIDAIDKAAKDPSSSQISSIFTHQLGSDVPRLYRQLNFQLRFVKSNSFLKSLQIKKIADLNGQMMNPGLTCRATDKLARYPDAKERILSMFDALIQVTTMALMHYVAEECKKGLGEVVAAATFIDEMLAEVFDQPRQEWVPTTKLHESCDVSCLFGQLPIQSQPGDLRYIYFRLSFDIDDRGLEFVAHQIERSMCHE